LTTLTVEIPDGTARAERIRADIIALPLSQGLSHFILSINNQDGSYNSTFSPQNSVDLKADNVTILKGYVDDIISLADDRNDTFRHLLRVTGRGVCQDLASLFHTEEYPYNTKIDDLIENALDTAYTGYPDPPGRDITYTSGSSESQIAGGYTAKDTYLLNIFKDVMERENYDGYVNDSKALQLINLSSPPASGITLKCVNGASDNNILGFSPIEYMWSRGLSIYNYVKVVAGRVRNGYSHYNASDWTPIDAGTTVADETTIQKTGASIKGTYTFGAASPLHFYLDFSGGLYSKSLNYLDWSIYGQEEMACWAYITVVGNPASRRCRFYLKDSAGNRIYYYNAAYEGAISAGTWCWIGAPVGMDCAIKAGPGPPHPTNDRWYYDGAFPSFNWQIEWLGFSNMDLGDDAGNYQDKIIIDDMRLPEEMLSISEDAASQASYRKKQLRIPKPYIATQIELDDLSAKYLAILKDPPKKFTCWAKGSTGLIGGANKWLPANTLTLNVPGTDPGLGISNETWRMGAIHHILEPYEDKGSGHDWVVELELFEQSAKIWRNLEDVLGGIDERIRGLEIRPARSHLDTTTWARLNSPLKTPLI